MNEFILIGTLTQAFPMEETSSGISVVNFLVKCDKPFKSSGISFDEFKVTAFKNVAEDFQSFARVGQTLSIRGRLQANNYSKEEKTYYSPELLAERINVVK